MTLHDDSTARLVRSVFSTGPYRDVLAGRSTPPVDGIIRQVRAILGVDRAQSNLAALNTALDYLAEHHRSEYYFRNLLANHARCGVMLNEFRVGASIADCVLIEDDRATVYEIKTMLDSPLRLAKQLDDYYRCFTNVVVLTDIWVADIYMDFTTTHPVGQAWNATNSELDLFHPPKPDTSLLEIDVMVAALRHSEMKRILIDCLGVAPQAPNTKRWAAYLEAARTIPVRQFQKHLVHQLALRANRVCNDFLSNPDTNAIRALTIALDPTRPQLARLTRWLNLNEDGQERIGG